MPDAERDARSLAGPVFVTGATGAQGGSVARALLARGVAVRALTRRARSEVARALAARGAEVVEGDLSDLARLTRVMAGCPRVFGVTSYWEHFATEVVHGKNIVDAARTTRVAHLILSTLPSAARLSGGAVAVPHLDSKASIEAYARAVTPRVPATFLHVALPFETFLTLFVPRAAADGTLVFGFPQGDTKLAGLAADDVGALVLALFEDGAAADGRVVGAASEELRGDEYAGAMSEALGREIRYCHVPAEEYARSPVERAADLAALFDVNRRFVLTRAADVERTRALAPQVMSFRTWARANRARLEQAIEAAS